MANKTSASPLEWPLFGFERCKRKRRILHHRDNVACDCMRAQSSGALADRGQRNHP
jgi:hypothetical protein